MATTRRLALGIDVSTQSISASIIDIDKAELVHEYSLAYGRDSRLSGFGFNHETLIVPPREAGEADQPPLMFVAGLEALFSDLHFQGIALKDIAVINTSGQQHGHVYLNAQARERFAALRKNEAITQKLVQHFDDVWAYGTAPIWKTSSTGVEAEEIRSRVGGADSMISLSGSNSPLRFTGAVMRRVGKRFPEPYAATERVLLISSLVPAILVGDTSVPADFGNGAGMSVMNYANKAWDKALVSAASSDLAGGEAAFLKKLGGIEHPLQSCGTIAHYFSYRFGFSSDCKIIIGSGDNPQTKVLAEGDLLSLGTSFVLMLSSKAGAVDMAGAANAMYDGLGRPFIFACRTNGALAWDRIRSLHGLDARNFQASEEALETLKPGSAYRLYQPDAESFPISAATHGVLNWDGGPKDFAHDYAGSVDSALGLLYHYGQKIAGAKASQIYITGGPTSSPGILKRVASLWNCPVRVLGSAGAALGAALAGAVALAPTAKREGEARRIAEGVLSAEKIVQPDAEISSAYHNVYLPKLVKHFESL